MNLAPSSAFRPIYYLGCKSNFTPIIKDAIDEVDPTGGRVLDLFAGTGVVGAALGASRAVTAVDIQEYSRVICSAVLNPPKLGSADIDRIVEEIRDVVANAPGRDCLSALFDYEDHCIMEARTGRQQPLVELLESSPLVAFHSEDRFDCSARLQDAARSAFHGLESLGLWNSADTLVTRQFGGVYFSYQQAWILDAILFIAAKEATHLRDGLIAAALSTASQIVNTVGKQFAQPLRPRNKSGAIKNGLVRVVQRDRSIDAITAYRDWLNQYSIITPAREQSEALRRDYLEALRDPLLKPSALYADPPYTRDHYSRFYHVLETLCLRDNPEVSRVRKHGAITFSRGVYREARHQSPFCIRSEAPSAFDALFAAARQRNLPLVLSYSPHEAGDGTHPRVVSMAQVVDIAGRHYRKFEIETIEGSSHNKLNRADLELRQREHAEILIKCYV